MIVKRFKVKLGSAENVLLFEIPFDVKEVFGQARPPVWVTVNKHRFRSTVAVYSGKSYIGVSRPHREAAGVEVGDMVSVVLEKDEEERVVEPPAELAAALAKDARARKAWERLSYTHQLEHARAILEAKKSETRARRVEKALEMLKSKP